jgi:GNAT superfamily N-acetyltransferase
MWKRATSYVEIQPVFELVEPDENVWDREGICDKHPDRYQAYTTVDGCAIGIVCWLPVSKVLHIETFALHPEVRGQGRARWLFASLLAHVAEHTDFSTDRLLIEVYPQNVEVWRKIMGVTEVDVGGATPLYLKTPVTVMGKNADRHAYAEWQTFQRAWSFPDAERI